MKAEEDSKKALDAMIAEPAFFDALAMGLDGQEKIPTTELQSIREWLERVSAEKQLLVEWCEEAQQRVRHIKKTGPKTGRTALVVFVQTLNRFLKRHTNKPISTGKGCLSFAVKVCTIAFPGLLEPDRKETIIRKPYDRAERRVKKAIEQALEDDFESEEISDWQHLVPDWKPATRLVLEAKGVHIYFCTDGDDYTNWQVKISNPAVTEVIYPGEPVVSDEVAARHSNMKLPPDWVTSSSVPKVKPH